MVQGSTEVENGQNKKLTALLSDITELPCIQLGDFTLQFELEELNDAVKEISQKELRETEDVVGPAVEQLRELLREDKELLVPYDNKAYLIRFLRPCKFYPQSAYELIKRYYAFKIKHKAQYDGLTPSREKNIFESNILTVCPNRDQHGRRILILELGKKWNHKKVTLDEVFKGCVLFLEAAMLEPETQVCGAVVIFDMEGLSLQQVWQFSPPFAKRIVDWLQESVPLRVKNIHIINQPTIFNMVFTLFKPFLREKLRSRRGLSGGIEKLLYLTYKDCCGYVKVKVARNNRALTNLLQIIFHGTDRDSLHNYMNPKCLPECYGGTVALPRINGNQWYDLLVKCDQEYLAINKYGYNKLTEVPEEKSKSKKK